MKNCKKCGSYAINHNLHGRDGSRDDLCDVCFWREKYKDLLERSDNVRIKLVESIAKNKIL